MLQSACCKLHVANCRMHVACCILNVANCMLQIACCKLHVAKCMLIILFCKTACCKLHVRNCTLQHAICKLHVANCMLQITCCKLHVANCKLQVTNCILQLAFFKRSLCIGLQREKINTKSRSNGIKIRNQKMYTVSSAGKINHRMREGSRVPQAFRWRLKRELNNSQA